MILDAGATILCCTPTYALRLAEVARQENVKLAASKIRRIIVAGEPGGSVPAVRRKLEESWPGATVFDHHGMTETGPVTYECPARPGYLHVIESAYLAEVLDTQTRHPVAPGGTGELLLTTLNRIGSPVIRYRTGDLVKADPRRRDVPCSCGRFEVGLEGGVLGRVDDMVIIRGVNIYPAALDSLLQECGDVAEYQAIVKQSGSLRELSLRIEPLPACTDVPSLVIRVRNRMQEVLSLRVEVEPVAVGGLPRFEMKAKRWVTQ
jgi:phenylacetate-CoA ligase